MFGSHRWSVVVLLGVFGCSGCPKKTEEAVPAPVVPVVKAPPPVRDAGAPVAVSVAAVVVVDAGEAEPVVLREGSFHPPSPEWAFASEVAIAWCEADPMHCDEATVANLEDTDPSASLEVEHDRARLFSKTENCDTGEIVEFFRPEDGGLEVTGIDHRSCGD